MCRHSTISHRGAHRHRRTHRELARREQCHKYRASNGHSCTPIHSRAIACRTMALRRHMKPLWAQCSTTSILGASTSSRSERSAVIGRWHVSPIKFFRYEKGTNICGAKKVYSRNKKKKPSCEKDVQNRFNFFSPSSPLENNFPFSNNFYLFCFIVWLREKKK